MECNGCRACCMWGSDKSLRPKVKFNDDYAFQRIGGVRYLKAINGQCVYLGDEGCTIHDTRPDKCRKFDCRELLKIVENKTDGVLMKVLTSAIRLNVNDQK